MNGTNNTNMAVTVTTNAQPTLAIVGKTGKELGTVRPFCGQKTAASLRAEGKALGNTGKELTKWINAKLKGEFKTAAVISARAEFERLLLSGFVPTASTERKNTARMEFAKGKADEAAVSREAALAALGLTEEDVALLSKE